MKFYMLIPLCFLLTACFVSKSLEREVSVKINTNFDVTLINTGNSIFTNNYSKADYVNYFIDGMKSEFSTSNIVISESNPEFEITITEFEIKESTSIYTVKDSTSADDGKKYDLSKLYLNSSGTIKQTSTHQIYNWSAYKDKEEKVTSLRNVGQMVTNSNVNHNQYRKKEFSSNVAANLSVKCGRRSGVSIVKEIFRALK